MVDLASALAGRFAGVEVRSTSSLGGSSALMVRGSRTLGGLSQPLIVVAPSLKFTVPVGVWPVIVAVNVTLWPKVDGLADEPRPVVVVAAFTT